MHRYNMTRSCGPLLCHSSMNITSCCSMIMHCPMLQGSVHNSWKLKTSQFLHGQQSPGMSPIEHVWDALDRRIRQRVPVLANIPQLHTAIEEEWTNMPQSTTWSTLWEDVLHCVRQMVVTPDTDPPPPPNTVKLYILELPFIVASLRHTCAIIMLSNQHLDMPHLWGG